MVVKNVPLTSINDPDEVAVNFLTQIGYLSEGYNPRTNVKSIRESIPYRLFVECLLRKPEKGWKVDELTGILKTTPPTVYRHLNKIKTIGILEEDSEGDGENGGKSYRLKYRDISVAWNFVETNARAVMQNYRNAVDFIEDEMKSEKKVERKEGNGDIKKDMSWQNAEFSLKICDAPIRMNRGIESAVTDFLISAGYITRIENIETEGEIRKGIPYRLFVDCFMKRRDRLWEVDALATYLNTTRPTVYRHLNKLQSLGLLEGFFIGKNYPLRKGYCLRYGNLSQAWYFVEENVHTALQNYRKSVDHLYDLISKKEGGEDKCQKRKRRKKL